MPRKETEDTCRKHIWVFQSDWEWLEGHFGSTVGISRAIRHIIRTFRKQMEAKALTNAQHLAPADDIDIPVGTGPTPEP